MRVDRSVSNENIAHKNCINDSFFGGGLCECDAFCNFISILAGAFVVCIRFVFMNTTNIADGND